MTAGIALTVDTTTDNNMPKTYLYFLPVLPLVAAFVLFSAAVIHSNGDNPVDNPAEYATPTPTPTVQAEPTASPSDGPGNARKTPSVVVSSTPEPQEVVTPDPCERSKREAEQAGWKILSCDPLRVMPLEEWNTKSVSSNFRYQPGLYCFDESNFAGIFKEQLGEDDGTGYYPEWLSEVKLDNGCSFFFHPTQGRENSWPAEKE